MSTWKRPARRTSGGAVVEYDSPSYFNDEQSQWHCPLTPPEVDAAIMRAEGMRQGTVPRAATDPRTRPSNGGACSCTTGGLPTGAIHSVKCASRFAAPTTKPTEQQTNYSSAGATRTPGTFTWDTPPRPAGPGPFAAKDRR